MINMMILTEFGHSLEIVNAACAFGVSSYSLFCTKKPLRNLITSPPPPSEKKLKRHKQTNKHSLQNITYQHDVTNHFSKTDFANA